jgi:DNA-binding NarL/FixJ family response regulator
VLVGDVGVGKTALWHAALADAKVAGDRVVRCVATHAAATVPLAALAPLLDSSSAAEPPLERILLALDGLLSDEHGNVVLAVDDAHLLDEASAAAVRAAAETGRAVVLLTVRAGEHAPDAIAGLWKDGLAQLVDIEPLDDAETSAMVADLIDGDVDAGTAARLFAVTGGNPLFLRELVAHGRAIGALMSLGGLWTWNGELRPGPRLVDIVAARLDTLDPDARYAAELVAAAEPVPLDALSAVVAAGPLAAAERAGVLVTERSRRRALVRCAHPLHAAALRERAAQSAVRAGLAVLADAMEANGARRADDPLRIGLWLLEAGRASRPALLTMAAARGHAHGHVLLAERLARAALDAGGGDDARLVLHQALIWQARVREADAIVVGAADDEESRTLLAGARVDAFLVGVERYEDVVAGLDAAEVTVRDPDLRAELAARRSGLDLAATGCTRAAIEPWDALAGGPPIVTLRLAFGAAPALAAAGRTDDAIAAAERGLAALRALSVPQTFAAEQLAASSGFAYLLAGRLADADACVLGAYAAALRAGDRYAQALLAVPAAELDLWRGRARAGARRAAEALALTDGVDRMGFRPWAAALREYALAWVGEPPVADDRALLDAPWPHSGEFLHAFGRLSRARAALARGEASAAADLAHHLGDLAEARGQPAVAALAHHVVARAGGARRAAPVLERLASACDGALVPLLAAHARALSTDDADALEATAAQALAVGLAPLAAEAAARAAALHHRAARRAAAGRADAARRAAEAGVDAPVRYAFPTAGAPSLTRRELEVASLAARGLTNAEVAERLGVSVRTVHTHLQAAYLKLGTNERAALTAALAGVAGR